MRRVIRLGVMVALATGAGMASTGARADDPASGSRQAAAEAATPPSSGSGEDVFSPGAGGMEPQPKVAEGIDEEPGTAAHLAWVASIWNSP